MKTAVLSISLLALMTFSVVAKTPTSFANCDSIPGIESVLRGGTAVLLGEIHGTNEAPAMVANVTCNALKQNLSVTVALEIPIEEEDAVNRYLAGEGTTAEREALIAGDFWLREYQDGRSSSAMADLIETIRQFRKTKGDSVSILLLDNPESDLGRDRFMAGRIESEMEKSPERLIVSLTGNVHNQIMHGNDFEPMGYHLVRLVPERRIVSLDLVHAGGTAWVCAAGYECGPMKLGGDDDGRGCYLFEDESENPRTGLLSLGNITASRPAKDTAQKGH